MTATYSFEDNKLRLYSVERLDTETYTRIKTLGFSWAPQQKLFVAPMWTPAREAVLIELAGSIENEDITLEERAIERSERFETYSSKRAADAETAANYADTLSEPFANGQPILVGHHSELKARRLAERIETNMRKAVQFYETSEYWTSRSQSVIQAAARKERPAVRIRRTKRLQADLRRCERSLAVSVKPENIEHYTKWTNHTKNRINYEIQMLQASGHQMPDFKAIAAERRKKSTSIPIVNCPGEGIVPCTREQYSKIPKDYRGVRRSKCGTYRYRIAIERFLGVKSTDHGHGYPRIFITDQKRVDEPVREVSHAG